VENELKRLKDELKKALEYMVTEYCRFRKEGNHLLANSILDDITGFKLGLYYAHVFSSEELDKIENDVKTEWGK
jgi:hypothetical protein